MKTFEDFKQETEEKYCDSPFSPSLEERVDEAAELYAEYRAKEAAYAPYQKCPICNGEGKVLSDGFTSSVYQVCSVCNGQKIIPQHIVNTGNKEAYCEGYEAGFKDGFDKEAWNEALHWAAEQSVLVYNKWWSDMVEKRQILKGLKP